MVVDGQMELEAKKQPTAVRPHRWTSPWNTLFRLIRAL